jgi:hypothetical protein
MILPLLITVIVATITGVYAVPKEAKIGVIITGGCISIILIMMLLRGYKGAI